MKSKLLITLATLFWLGLIGWGLKILLEYDNKVQESGNHPQHWLAQSKIPFSKKNPTLLIFVHPGCPCTKASLEELNRLLTNFPDKLNAQAIFLKAEGTKENWHQTELWKKANKIKGLNTFLDEDGREARLFSVKASGRTLVYDTKASLIFYGGLTSSRGHEGDNIGRSSIEHYLRSGHLLKQSSPSFGCALFTSEGI